MHKYSPRGQLLAGFCNFIILVGIDLSKQTSESRVKISDLRIQSLYVLTLSFSETSLLSWSNTRTVLVLTLLSHSFERQF